MILEGIMTTLDEQGRVNIAPMGPLVDATMSRLVLRPYQTSTTYVNLKRSGQGVFHVIDDVELLARAAVGAIETLPPLLNAAAVEGRILADCCRWYALRVQKLDDREPRTEIITEVVERGTRREFFGFNRAKHAVLEAAILATRLEFLSPDHILKEFARLSTPVEKTGGTAELRAFDFLQDYVRTMLSSAAYSDLTS